MGIHIHEMYVCIHVCIHMYVRCVRLVNPDRPLHL